MSRADRRKIQKLVSRGGGPSQPKPYATVAGAKKAGQTRGIKCATNFCILRLSALLM